MPVDFENMLYLDIWLICEEKYVMVWKKGLFEWFESFECGKTVQRGYLIM